MPYQNIDVALSPADAKAVKDAFDTVLKKLPFLINLTPQERKNTFKAGPDSLSFVQNALTAAQDHPHRITEHPPRQLRRQGIQERCRSLHHPHRVGYHCRVGGLPGK
uniref:Uncharacterized protein n=1 Tax=Candidatus Kentrum sp. DK TaxID=2126562 RepID=A0A450TJ98_9GAMM|nr:MAG: hypothetical protein BECKDK2373C_GA0170839_116510 [Candidatus Kentron sp. DK]